MAQPGAPPLASPLVAEALAGLQTTQDARIWLPADQLYGLRLAAGADAWVGVARGSGSSDPAPLVQLFAAADRLPGMQTGLTAGPDAEKQQFGACLVAAQVWPAQGLQKGTAALSPALRDALARPEARTRLLVYAAEQDSSISSISSSRGREADSSGSAEVAQRCTAAVYVRLCRRQGLGGSPGPALLPPVTSDEAASSSSAEAADQTATRMAPASPAGVLSPAMRGKAGSPVALSPAMRGGATPPIALSPAMRGGAAPPVALGPAGRAGSSSSTASPAMPSRGRPGSATLSSGSKSRPPTHLASSTSSASRGIAAAARADDRANAEALLGKLLEEDPSPRVRGMVEGLLLRCLAGRRLLPGNLVVLPLFGEHAVFAVEHVALAGSGGPASQAASGAAVAQPASQPDGQAVVPAVPPPVTAETSVRLLMEGEAPPACGLQPQPQSRDWPVEAAAAAAEALGCGLEDAGAVAAARAVGAGLASRGITFGQLGGTDKQAAALQELVVLPLQAPQLFASYNITPPRGVLLYGPPGTGKTVLACATAAAVGAHFFVINGPEVVSEYSGESEAGLRGIFAAAAALQPSVIFIDELDALAPSRGGGLGGGKASSGGGSSARVVTTLLTEMDALGYAQVVVVAATNRPDSLDEALRRPGRFDREVEVGVPPPVARRDILTKQLASITHSLTPDQVAALADAAHGFVAADLAALCSEAAMIALRRLVAQSRGSSHGDASGGSPRGTPCVTLADFQAAETRVRPSAMRELAFEVPKVSWDDIGGLEDVKQRLKEAVELPFQEPEALARLGVVPPRGILLHGPPGCSKTLLARAVASMARLNFISVKGPELYNKYVGESEKALAALFAKARASSPAIIFFDEIDGLAKMREASGEGGVGVGERMLAQLLQEMDGLQSRVGVVVIGATNRPDCLDPALLRPGRFDRLVEVPPPDCAGRAAIFSIHTRHMPLSGVDLQDLAEQSEGFTGATIAACCREAALCALQEDINATVVAARHFNKALSLMHSRQQLL